METPRFDELAQRLGNLIPEPAKELHRDLEKNLKATLQNLLQKMDLVTREEYELQTALLSRTRERLEALERRVATLETQAGSGETPENA